MFHKLEQSLGLRFSVLEFIADVSLCNWQCRCWEPVTEWTTSLCSCHISYLSVLRLVRLTVFVEMMLILVLVYGAMWVFLLTQYDWNHYCLTWPLWSELFHLASFWSLWYLIWCYSIIVFSAAIQALKRKKRFEKQLQQIDGTLSTIEFQREALENASTNTEVLRVMGDAAKALKSAHKNM